MVEAVDADVAVYGLRLVLAECLEAEKAVYLEADEKVFVERNDAGDVAIFLNERGEVPYVDLGLSVGVVQIEVVVLVYKAHHPGLVIDFADGLGMEVLRFELHFRCRGVCFPGRERIDADISFAPFEVHEFSRFAHEEPLLRLDFLRKLRLGRNEPLFDGVVVVQRTPADEPRVSLRVGREVGIVLERIRTRYLARRLGQPVQGLERIHPQIVSVGLADGADDVVGEGAVGPEVRAIRLHGRSVVTVKAVVRAHPHQICIVLENRQYGAVGKAFGISHLVEFIRFGKGTGKCQQQCKYLHDALRLAE